MAKKTNKKTTVTYKKKGRVVKTKVEKPGTKTFRKKTKDSKDGKTTRVTTRQGGKVYTKKKKNN